MKCPEREREREGGEGVGLGRVTGSGHGHTQVEPFQQLSINLSMLTRSVSFLQQVVSGVKLFLILFSVLENI